jgi:hypothetical protein
MDELDWDALGREMLGQVADKLQPQEVIAPAAAPPGPPPAEPPIEQPAAVFD